MELIPRCQRENSNKDWSWRQKELFTRRQQRKRGIPERESLGIFIPKVDPSWRQKELIQRCQRENSYVVYNSYMDPSWHQKELITRCQRENFAPTEFEIQIWVLNFGREVDYTKIQRNGFPFARLTFLLSQRSGNKTDVCYDFKIYKTGNICP